MKPTTTKSKCARLLNVSFSTCRQINVAIKGVRQAIKHEFSTASDTHRRLVQLALNEAEAIAWQTLYPHLLFPTLARERVQAVAVWQSRQQVLRERESALAFTA